MCNNVYRLATVSRGAGSGGAGGPINILKTRGQRGQIVLLVLRIYFFSYAQQLTYIILITIKSNNVCKITKTTVTHSTVIKYRVIDIVGDLNFW